MGTTAERDYDTTRDATAAPDIDPVSPVQRRSDALARASHRSRAGQAADIQRALTVQRAAAEDTDAVHQAAAHGISDGGGALPHLDAIQRSFGRHDVSSVQAHVGGKAADASAAMGAQAYATGSDVAFAQSPDLHTAAHEAAHIVQQRAGVALKGGVGQAGDPYERHADAVADRVVQGESAVDLLDQMAGGGTDAVQRAVQRRGVQRAPGDRYDRGNRPQPAESDDVVYTIESNAPRLLKVGERVTYSLRQTTALIAPADASRHVAWHVTNDPSAVGISKEFDGPADAWSWDLYAAVEGVHEIQATVTYGERESQLSFTQVVVSNDRTYARLPEGTAAAPLSTIEDFIALVERVEAAYGGLPWQDVASKLRKEYYPGEGGTYGGIKRAFTWDDLIDEQQDMPPLQTPPVDAADIAALRQNIQAGQTITVNGEALDIGHVLTGVDSMNFPKVAGLFDLHDMSGPAAATWAGDVGSALVAWANGGGDASERETTYGRLMSTADLFADIDGIAIADLDNLSPTASFSERLRAYYVTPWMSGAERRYHRFCATSGFRVAGGRLAPDAVTWIESEILAFAKGYNVKGSLRDGLMLSGSLSNPYGMGMGMGGFGMYGAGTFGSTQSTYEMTTTHRIAENVGWFAARFVQDIEAGLASESRGKA